MSTKVKDIASLGEVQMALKSTIKNLSSMKERDEWKNYQNYINSLVLNGIIELIHTNLKHLHSFLDPTQPPFTKVKLLLEDKKVVFYPEFKDSGSGKSIKNIITHWINSFIYLSTLFRQRIDTSMGDYMVEVLDSNMIQHQVFLIYNEVNELSKESDNKLTSFGDFKFLWEKDFEESFKQFLSENTQIPEKTPEELERQEKVEKIFNDKNPNPITKNIEEYTPAKEVFDDKINEFKDKLKKVRNMEKEVQVRWIMVDFSEFQEELCRIIETWIQKYKEFLQNNSRSKLANINSFMERIEKGIENKPKETTTEEDKKKFFTLLENIRDMDLLFPKIVELIPGIKGELDILKKHTKSENDDDPYDIEDKNVDSEEQR